MKSSSNSSSDDIGAFVSSGRIMIDASVELWRLNRPDPLYVSGNIYRKRAKAQPQQIRKNDSCIAHGRAADGRCI